MQGPSKGRQRGFQRIEWAVIRAILAALAALALLLCFGGGPVLAQAPSGQTGVQPPVPSKARGRSKAPVRKPKKDDQRPVEEQLAESPLLTARVQGLLPTTINVRDAAEGFKDLDQFLTAVHATDNLNIPFTALKTRLTGKKPQTFTAAIHELNPNVNAEMEAARAESEAKDDIRASQSPAGAEARR